MMACVACDEARQRAKAEGHRNWRRGFACYDCAAVDLDQFFQSIGYVPDEAQVRAAAKQMGIPYVGPATQP